MVSQLAVSDLALRLKVAEGDVKIKSVQAVDWPDTALGCPQPGQMYAQVITSGYRIILTAGGKDFEYHSDRSRVIPCPPK
jgi:hypothetical protein